MQSFGAIIKEEREKRKLFLRHVAAAIDVDQSLVSKFEKGERKPSREQVLRFAKFFELDEEKLLVAWMSDKAVYAIEDEKLAKKVLKAAEEKVAYQQFKKIDRNAIFQMINEVLSNDGRIAKAWVFGSFIRRDDHSGSDIDMMIAEKKHHKFNYFDLADIQYKLEHKLGRKVDIGFASSLRENIAQSIQNEAQLVYEDR